MTLPVCRVTTLDLVVEPYAWPFAIHKRDEIDAHFAMLRQRNPALWNGRVLLARNPVFDADTFSARYFETDFASFIAWRDWGFVDSDVFNAPGCGALRSTDGGFLLGQMAPHTANAGRIYFPAGTPDLNDVKDGRVDIAGSVEREVEEETGLTPSDYTTEPGWHCVCVPGQILLIRILQVNCASEELKRRVEQNLTMQITPEFSDVFIVHSAGDMTSAVLPYVGAFINTQ